MHIARFIGATLASFLLLVGLNMFAFPLVFPDGVASKSANARPTPLLTLHLAAFLATATLLTALCADARMARSSAAAAGIGALDGQRRSGGRVALCPTLEVGENSPVRRFVLRL